MPNFIYNNKAFLLEFIFCPNKNQMFPVTGSHVFQKWFPMVSLFVANKNFSVWQFLLGFSLIKNSPRCEPLSLGNKKCGRKLEILVWRALTKYWGTLKNVQSPVQFLCKYQKSQRQWIELKSGVYNYRYYYSFLLKSIFLSTITFILPDSQIKTNLFVK